MAKEFNIQGGYFSPPGYLKVETGGSHDENPNGGVQIGVDPNGVPNMLEEGEPVYDDYVYSDNITADKAILEQFHIPEKYAGKLYSEIADTFVDEAEDRPLDAISNNGLRAMLGRLADAQEQQKQNQEQKELEDELANMSPEELAELEAMLGQQEGAGEQVTQEQGIPAQQSVMPVMENGGPLSKRQKKLISDTLYDLEHGRSFSKEEREKLKRDELQAKIDAPFAPLSVHDLKKYIDNPLLPFVKLGKVISDYKDKRALEKQHKDVVDRVFMGIDPFMTYSYGGPINKFDGWSTGTNYLNPSYAFAKRNPHRSILPKAIGPVRGISSPSYRRINPTLDYVSPDMYDVNVNPFTSYAGMGFTSPNDIDISGDIDLDGTIRGLQDELNPIQIGPSYSFGDKKPYRNISPRVSIPTDSISSPSYRKIKLTPDYVSPDMYDVDLNQFNPYDGIEFTSPDSVDISGDVNVDGTVEQLKEELASPKNDIGQSGYPTWMRYAGALGHGLLALGNAVTPQTRFTSRQARPYYPTGRINLIDPTYNPIDFGLTENALLASGAGTVNVLRNSGSGPSTAASIIAADRNLGQNLGMGFLQNWNANNQQRNDVIAARNNNATQRANFNYQIDAARAQALDNAQRFNIQNDLYLQRLNDNAESQKYAAISGELGYGLDALTKTGDENMAFNMVNSTSDYGYDDKSGRVRYKRRASNGRTLLKKYKK